MMKSSLLSPGMVFHGTQNVTSMAKSEEWRVTVKIQSVDFTKGIICGSMDAQNSLFSNSVVSTYWDGQIIDNFNYHFWTNQWDATKETDLTHWSKFQPFEKLAPLLKNHDNECVQKSKQRCSPKFDVNSSCIFMRWKEVSFVNLPAEVQSGLTIAGFYYICFNTINGEINGYYFDRASMPFQQLRLQPNNPSNCVRGIATPFYDFR
eukprot:Sdes_comp17437_c0_seq1m6662